MLPKVNELSRPGIGQPSMCSQGYRPLKVVNVALAKNIPRPEIGHPKHWVLDLLQESTGLGWLILLKDQ